MWCPYTYRRSSPRPVLSWLWPLELIFRIFSKSKMHVLWTHLWPKWLNYVLRLLMYRNDCECHFVSEANLLIGWKISVGFSGNFDSKKALLSSLELDKKSIVLISINDNDSVEAGGSHWSLLAWVKSEKKFYHFDSWGNAPSKSAALQTANKISAAIGSPMPVEIRIVYQIGIVCLLRNDEGTIT